MTDYVAKYTLRFNDLASRGLLRTSRVARTMGMALTVAATAGAAAVGGLVASGVRLSNVYAERADEMAKFSRETGFAADALQQLEFASGIQGADFEGVKATVRTLNKRVGELRGGFGALNTALTKLDPALKKSLVNSENSTEAYWAMMEAIAGMPDEMDRAALAAAAFSKRGAAEAMRLAEGGVDAIRALRAESERLRPALTKAQRDDAEKYNDSLFKMKFALGGVSDAIASKLLPRMTPLIEDFTDFIVLNRDLAATKAVEFFENLKQSTTDFNFKEAGENMLGVIAALADILPMVATMMRTFVDAVGGAENAVKIVFATAVISKVAGLYNAMVLLGGGARLVYRGFMLIKSAKILTWMAAGASKSIIFAGAIKTKLVAALALMKMNVAVGAAILKTKLLAALVAGKAIVIGFGAKVAALASGALVAFKAALLSVGKAILVVGRFFLLNPIGLAITAIVGAGYLLWENWDLVKQKAKELWDFLKPVWSQIFGVISSNIRFITGAVKMGMAILTGDWRSAMQTISTVASGIWDGIKGFFASGVNWVIAQINKIIGLWNDFASSSAGDFLGAGTINSIQKIDVSGAAQARAQSSTVRIEFGGRVEGAKGVTANATSSNSNVRTSGSNFPIQQFGGGY